MSILNASGVVVSRRRAKMFHSEMLPAMAIPVIPKRMRHEA
jgi:hypothetical protein